MAKNHENMLTIPGHNGNANQNHTKIPPHTCQNSYHQEHQQQMARMWENKNPQTLLVGMKTSTTTLENNMEAP
jgi:hypothetical protein